MNNDLNELIKELRKLNNQERFSWILDTYPLDNKEYYYAFQIIPHFTWGKKERKFLMKYYLSKLPFSSERPYLAFFKISPLSEFLDVIIEIVNSKNGEDLSLLEYFLEIIIENDIDKKDYNQNKEQIELLFEKIKREI